jgi:hypothetical protein
MNLVNRKVHLRWHMNLYLHYGIGHKQSVLKSKDQAKSNTEQTIKYNLYSRTRKHPKTRAVVGKKSTAGDGVCRTRAATRISPAATEHHQARRKRGHHARPKEWQTPCRVMTTRRSMVSFSVVASSGRTGGRRRARLGGACRLEIGGTEQIWP